MTSSYQIINEYGILKKILSSLDIVDLVKASEVNRYWKNVADIIIQENNEIACYVKYAQASWPEFNRKIRPKLILYMNDSESTESEDLLQLIKVKLPEVGKCLKKSYNIDESFFLYLANWKFFNSIKKDNKLVTDHSTQYYIFNIGNKENPFKESLLMIPEFSSLKIDVKFFNMYKMKTVEKDYNDVVDKICDSTCCLFLTNSDLKNKVTTEIIKIFCNKSQDRGCEPVMAGGISSFMMCFNSSFIRVGGAVVAFSGESLTAKSFVLTHKDPLPDSFMKIKEIIGPLESGYVRLAFLFTCVDRFSELEESETEEFSAVFPDVPLYGFWSLGEFGHGYTSLWQQRKKPCSNFVSTSGQQFFFQQASSYLFLTFKK